ncbi:MAG: ATP-NAD kinase family protein [Anaerolineae bacterium]
MKSKEVMISVGIIANPASGKDIRRLVAHGTVFSNQEKSNIVRRLLLALEAMEVEHVYIMPDIFGIGRHALDGLKLRGLAGRVSILGMNLENDARDSERAAAIMRELRVRCIITLGGDGTNRVVAKTCGEVPLVPISTGTNNVVPYMIEGTTAGLAAGFLARNPQILSDVAYRSKRLEVLVNGRPAEIALVDVSCLRGTFVGTKAVWDPAALIKVIAARGEPWHTGMSALAGFFRPLGPRDEAGLVLKVSQAGEKEILRLQIPLAPGLISSIGISQVKELPLDEGVSIEERPCILALDGERELPLYRRDRAEVYLRGDGPWIVDLPQALSRAVQEGAFVKEGNELEDLPIPGHAGRGS